MKAIAFLISSFLLLSLHLSGQQNNELRAWSKNQDTSSLFPKNSDPPENFYKKQEKKPDMYGDRKKHPDGDRFRKNFPIDPGRKPMQDSIAEKRYPGSSRFYARSLPSGPYSGYGKSFIVVPDTSAKHYLIIMNPLTGEITK